MKKIWNIGIISFLLLVLFFLGSLWADKETLRGDVVRLHILANSDSEQDQSNKLAVRDSVLAYLNKNMPETATVEQALVYLQENREPIQNVANATLRSLNSGHTATVSLVQESFDTRHYETFSLPAGVYRSLKIEIGSGEGKNWWCVVFPALCLPASSAELQDTAVSAGLQQELVSTVAGEPEYQFRFFILDCMGKIENFFHFE